ncbi:lipase [Nocardia stercoris]|uniref:Lipase n=2 Tax=Nocardia stercoris TaxID=2483361 RepID=A0A3M2L1Q1_9NOCA|nr:lipase [Nocardia stercoris]
MLIAGGVGAAAAADPVSPATEQQLADTIAAGLSQPVQPIAAQCGSGSGVGSGISAADCGDGSSSGSTGSTASDTTGFGPADTTFPGAFGYSLQHPDVAPPGTNNWNCKPTAQHPRPVVLVHGTWENAYDNFAFVSQPITSAGFCTFTFNYGRSSLLQGGGLGTLLPGIGGTGDIPTSATQLQTFVDRVLAATGAGKVDIVAHSQGGMMTRWYTEFDGGAPKVDHLIEFGATNHGTTLDGIATLGRTVNNLGIDVLGLVEILVGHGGIQQTIGSDVVTRLNANGDTVSGIDYTVVGTKYDEVTTPYQSTFLTAGPGATVKNITLQDGCAQDASDHVSMMYSPRALSIILNTLDPVQNPSLQCTANPWIDTGSSASGGPGSLSGAGSSLSGGGGSSLSGGGS